MSRNHLPGRLVVAGLLLALLGGGAVVPRGAGEPVVGPARFSTSYTHHLVQVDGGPIHAVVGGAGRGLVLLHGFPTTWWQWHAVMPELARSARVVAVDLPGFGDSARPGSGYDAATAAARVRAAVRALGLDRVTLVAHDLGGWVAHAWARDHPSEVAGVVALEALVPGPGTDAVTAGAFHIRFAQQPGLAERLLPGREAEFLSYFWGSTVRGRDREEYVRRYRGVAGLAAGLGHYRSLPGDAAASGVRLQAPVLTISGARGLGDGPATSWREVADRVTALVLPTTHWVVEEAPGAVVDAVLGQLSSIAVE